jgi:UDP-N-acetylglucosamine diphosphorylase/glucosamine-1-phosphate N-acetyltransferase
MICCNFPIGTCREIKCAYVAKLQHNWDIFQKNDTELRKDFDLVTANRKSMPLSPTNQLIGPESALFIEEGAVVEGAILNCQTGPIYIAAEAEVMEGTLIRGPFSLGEHSQIKMGAKIYGPTTIGPYCKVGGELNNVVFFGYSNKAHDGFMGNSVVGEWCNFGADTNTSNLKNNYGEIKVIDYETGIL